MPTTGGTWVEWQGTRYETNNITITNTSNWGVWNDEFTGINTGTLLSRYTQDNSFDFTWTTWNQTYTTTAANYTIFRDNVWGNWIQVGDALPQAQAVRGGVQYGAPALVRSEAEWTVIREEQDRQRRIRDEAQAGARAEARKLMAVVLSAEQLHQYETAGYFEVVGSEGGVYRIYHGTSGNIKQLVDGREVNALCVHPRMLDHRVDEGEGAGYLPTEDCMVAQAFGLMHDERGTVMLANVHRGQRHLRAVA